MLNIHLSFISCQCREEGSYRGTYLSIHALQVGKKKVATLGSVRWGRLGRYSGVEFYLTNLISYSGVQFLKSRGWVVLAGDP